MAGTMRNQFTAAMADDNYKYFWENYNLTAVQWESIFEVVKSSGAYEQFSSAIGLGELLEKPEGEDLRTDTPIESYTIVCKNAVFGRVVRFSFESIDDSRKGNPMQNAVASWGNMVPITKEKYYAKFFTQGALTAGHDVFNNTITGVITDASGKFIYDGLPFFNGAHPDKVGNTYSNYTASRSLSHDNLQTTYNTYTITNNRDERGEIIDLMPDTLLIPPALTFTADAILNSILIPGSQDNDKNVLKSIITPMVWAYVADSGSDNWYIGKKKMGLMATDRMDVSMDVWQDEMSKDYFASILTRFGGCVTNFRYWYACNIAST